MPKIISAEIKEKARKLVIGGTTRKDAAFILNERVSDIYAWTKDIKLPRKRTTSKQEYIMKVLAEQGYYIPGKASDLGTLRILKEKQGIKLCHVNQTNIGVIKGRELDALKGFLRKKRIHYISSHKLSQIEHALGIKDLEKAKKELKDNNVKLTDFLQG